MIAGKDGIRCAVARFVVASSGALVLVATMAYVPTDAAGAAGAGSIAEFPLLTPKAFPEWITAGPNGNVWATEQAFNVAEVTPAGVVTEFPAPQDQSYLGGIAEGSDGNLWMAESTYNLPTCTGEIVKMTPTGSTTSFPTPGYAPTQTTEGPDGNIWFTSNACPNDHPALGSITPTGLVTIYPVSSGFGGGGPYAITTGPDGNLWFTMGSVVGKMTAQGAYALYPGNAEGYFENEITAGPDGNLWYTAWGGGGQVDSITTAGVVTEHTVDGAPFGIAAGPGDTLVVSLFGNNAVAQVDLNGNVLENVATPTQPSGPVQLVAGSDGNFWFAEQNADAVGRFSTTAGSLLATTVTVSKSPMVSEYGQSVTLTAVVSPDDGGGTVTFTGDGQSVNCANLPLGDVGGQYEATCTTSELPYGHYEIAANYSGDSNYQPARGTLDQFVTQANTKITAQPMSELSSLLAGGPTVSATLVSEANGGGPIPGQTIQFWFPNTAETLICVATTNASGVAKCTGPSSLDSDMFKYHNYVANYDGTVDYGASNGTGAINLL